MAPAGHCSVSPIQVPARPHLGLTAHLPSSPRRAPRGHLAANVARGRHRVERGPRARQLALASTVTAVEGPATRSRPGDAATCEVRGRPEVHVVRRPSSAPTPARGRPPSCASSHRARPRALPSEQSWATIVLRGSPLQDRALHVHRDRLDRSPPPPPSARRRWLRTWPAGAGQEVYVVREASSAPRPARRPGPQLGPRTHLARLPRQAEATNALVHHRVDGVLHSRSRPSTSTVIVWTSAGRHGGRHCRDVAHRGRQVPAIELHRIVWPPRPPPLHIGLATDCRAYPLRAPPASLSEANEPQLVHQRGGCSALQILALHVYGIFLTGHRRHRRRHGADVAHLRGQLPPISHGVRESVPGPATPCTSACRPRACGTHLPAYPRLCPRRSFAAGPPSC